MSLAEGILDIALKVAADNSAASVGKIGLGIGVMSGVEKEALEFSFRVISRDTIAEKAELAIRSIPLVGRCNKCGKETELTRYDFFCPHCEGGVLEIQSGREMRVEYVDVE